MTAGMMTVAIEVTAIEVVDAIVTGADEAVIEIEADEVETEAGVVTIAVAVIEIEAGVTEIAEIDHLVVVYPSPPFLRMDRLKFTVRSRRAWSFQRSEGDALMPW